MKAALVLLSMQFPQAQAHGLRSGPPVPGIQIPGLTRGQMAVISRYRGEILELASAQTDEQFRRLFNHGNLQYTYCLWGLMPGSLGDERSPFNECSHAYLAAAKALLAYMQAMPGARKAAEDLVSRIDADMVRSGASWILCQYSGEAFSTGEIVEPQWYRIVFHWPSLMTLLAGAALLATLVYTIMFQKPGPRGRVRACP